MTRAVAVLRPEPGNARTAARLAALGLTVLRMPLFRIVALDWAPPAGRFDALLLTSANAVRQGGAGLAELRALPVVAVGAATAAAARAAGFTVASVGTGDAADAVRAAGHARLLHLAGRHHVAPPGAVTIVPVYASEPLVPSPEAVRTVTGAVALLHSARAARAFAALAAARDGIRIAALSQAVAIAAGPGWADVAVAPAPTDAALVALARQRAIDP